MGLALIGSTILLWRRQAWVLPILALPALLVVFHLFFHAKDRFHIPIDPFVAVLAAVALVELGVWIARRVRSGRSVQPVDYTQRPTVGGAA